MFNLFRLLENKTLEMFSSEKDTKANIFGGTKVLQNEEVRKYFVNSKNENEVFG